MMVFGIDPGEKTGVACVDVGPTITVAWCSTVTGVRKLQLCLGSVGAETVAVEGWEYQGPAKSRGVPPQAEAYGRVVAVLELECLSYITVTRGQVLSSLNLPRNAKKAQVRERIRALTTGARPSNHHEADAVATAIAGAARLDMVC